MRPACLIVIVCTVSVASSISALDLVFMDGFESGQVCGWNEASPSATCYATASVLLPGFVAMSFVEIPGGTFIMGADEQGSDTDEDVHQVTLTSNYLIGKLEVTQLQWTAMGYANPSGYWSASGDYPVETVNFYEAAAYANAVSVSEGLPECYNFSNCTGSPGQGMQCAFIGVQLTCSGYRLPTEAEWERAARAITQSRFSHGDVLQCGDQCESCAFHDQYMLYCGAGASVTGPAGLRLPNFFGLHDMHGSVWEMVQDWYQMNLGVTSVTDPQGPTSGSERIIRGGAMLYASHRCRSAERVGYPMTSLGADVGFRLTRTLP